MRNVQFQDLVTAYRRAKVDLFRRDEPRLEDILAYEESLVPSLQQLLERISTGTVDWVRDPGFVGTFTLLPKAAHHSQRRNRSLVWSNPARAWSPPSVGDRSDRGPSAEFRLMASCSLDMHVLSTLWLMTVGDRFDNALGKEAYGSRLRRTRTGALNLAAPSSFKHYFGPFKSWRDGALGAMRRALDEDKEILALTVDATAFYHRLDPSFLENEGFIRDVLGIELDQQEQHLNHLMAQALQAWTQAMSDETGWANTGLPVGLPASAVVANLALIELDRLVASELKPVFYGRYVDDIILVIEDVGDLRDSNAVWDWIIARSRGLLVRDDVVGDDQDRSSIRFQSDHIGHSAISFDNDKNKIFHLTGSNGRFLLNSIRHTINRNTSAWRALPTIPRDRAQVGSEIIVATAEDGEPATTLRDADRVSARRAAFAIRLRDFEAYERDLDIDSWVDQREAFFDAVAEQILRDPTTYFELNSYVPRILKLAVACQDWPSLTMLIQALFDTYQLLTDSDRSPRCTLTVKHYAEDGQSSELIVERWRQHLYREVYESLAAGLAFAVDESSLEGVKQILGLLVAEPRAALETESLRGLHSRLFVRDLAHVPFRNGFLAPDFASPDGIPSSDLLSQHSDIDAPPLAEPAVNGLDLLGVRLRQLDELPARAGGQGVSATALLGERAGGRVPALAFSTRPFNMLELYLLLHGIEGRRYPFESSGEIADMLLALRGYRVDNLPCVRSRQIIEVADPTTTGRKRIAIAMLETEQRDLVAAAVGTPQLTSTRFERVTQLVNELIARPRGADYLLLPELALPAQWFIRFATKLQDRHINLISGIEYRLGPPGIVHNQVWAALRVGGMGFPVHAIYRQDKMHPALREESLLWALAGLRMEPELPWPITPIVSHGEFLFSLLVCSELTNIQHRSNVRGRIDALFVPAWNKDLHTFEALIESAALDVHTYVAQSNSRQYGDSRIRAPMAVEHERDLVRLRGGGHDYVIVGEIDYWALREHQSAHAARKPFKPTPDGFAIASERRRVPRV